MCNSPMNWRAGWLTRTVVVNAVHPGLVATGFGHETGWLYSTICKILQRLFADSPEKGAETLVYLAIVTPDVSGHQRQILECKAAEALEQKLLRPRAATKTLGIQR